MYKMHDSWPRRLLPLSIAALLLLAAAPPLPADEIAVGASAGYRQAGLRVGIGLGYYGHHHPFRGHWRPYYPYRYYTHVYPYVYYDTWGPYHPRYVSGVFGALDLNVKPKKTTQVYIDGNYVGTAANFDGWPQYLWLERDSYELILFNPGYETVVRHVEVQPGVVIRIREHMRPGESVPVAELTATRKPPAAAPSYARRAPPHRPPVEHREHAEPAPAPAPPRVLDVRPEPARVRILIAPADASVYLDGRFLGVAGELGEERSGILIEPGGHVLEVVRPGYESREVDFEAEAGGEVKLEIELVSGTGTTGFSA